MLYGAHLMPPLIKRTEMGSLCMSKGHAKGNTALGHEPIEAQDQAHLRLSYARNLKKKKKKAKILT